MPKTKIQNKYLFAIGKMDGTWREELVFSDSVVGAQCKVYEMYPRDEHPDISFRVFLSSIENSDIE